MISRPRDVGLLYPGAINELDVNIFVKSMCKFRNGTSREVGAPRQSPIDHRTINAKNSRNLLLRLSSRNKSLLDFLL